MDKYTLTEYLGDSVYIGLDDVGRLWIFTYNGVQTRNDICLETETIDNFLRIIEKFGWKR